MFYWQRDSMHIKHIFTAILIFTASITCSAAEIKPLPRIKVRPASPFAQFYNSENGREFNPEGCSYVHCTWIDGVGFPTTFAPGKYDPQDAENALSKMQQSGYTFVRVFCYKGHYMLVGLNPPVYCVGGPDSTNVPELSAPYMANVIDFLTRANQHNIYVSIHIGGWPWNKYYRNMADSGFSYITGSNREWLAGGAINAKKIYIGQFIGYIKNYNPKLLSTILAFDMHNEVWCTTADKPFSQTSGWVLTANGEEYDMSSPTSRQACQDENTNYWLNQCVTAVHTVDPNALVYCSVFPFLPVGKSGPTGLWPIPISTADQRWPARPLKLLESEIDFLDFHLYMGWDEFGTMGQCLESLEWSSLNKTNKPFIVGEFGAHRQDYPDIYNAAQALYNHREEFYDFGFKGSALFTWDLYQHTRWTAMEGGEIINERLKPNQRSNWPFNRDGFTQFWDSGQSVSDFNTNGGNLIFNINGNDSYLYSPLTALDSNTYRYFKIKLKNQTPGTEAQVFWTKKTRAAEVSNATPLVDDSVTVGLWHMDSSSGGKVPDGDSINPTRNNDLSIYNGAAITSGNQGVYSEALSFDGVDDFSTAQWNGEDTFLIDGWFKPGDITAFSPARTGFAAFRVAQVAFRANSCRFAAYNNAETPVPTEIVVTGVTNNTWFHVIASVDEVGDMALSVFKADGTLLGSVTGTTPGIGGLHVDTRAMYIGAAGTASNPYIGLIDDLKISALETDSAWNETKSVRFNIVPNCGDFKTYLVDLYNNPNWSGLVNQLRFEPANSSVSSGHYEIDFMEVIKNDSIIFSDINEDNTVDLEDFSIIARSWMDQTLTTSWSQGDLNNDLSINKEDIAKFANDWLQNISK
jgi:hypothetical protein